jgi:hypothetical protein
MKVRTDARNGDREVIEAIFHRRTRPVPDSAAVYQVNDCVHCAREALDDAADTLLDIAGAQYRLAVIRNRLGRIAVALEAFYPRAIRRRNYWVKEKA